MSQLSKYHRRLGAARRPGFCAGALWGVLLIAWVSGGCQSLKDPEGLDAPARFEYLVGKAPNSPSATQSGTLWYRLELAPHRLTVHIRLLKPPQRTTFFLPAQWAGNADYDRAIQIRGAQVPGRPAPYTIDRVSGRIEVDSDRADWVQLDYSVALSPRADRFGRFHPRFADDIFFAYGPAFLILPSAQIIDTIRDIPIEIHAPNDWKMLSTWSPRASRPSQSADGSTVHGYMAGTPAALRDAFVVAGEGLIVNYRQPEGSPHAAPDPPKPSSSITLGYDPQARLNRASFGQHISQILGIYRRKFGDLGPVSAYMREVAAEDGQDHLGVGRHGGFVIEVRDTLREAASPKDDDALDPQLLLLLAHEAFHMWNGHSLTPAPATEPKTRWFKEGFTHYMAIKTLAEAGLFSRDEVLAELAKSGGHYLRNPAARAASGPAVSTVDRARLPYDRGVLLALSIDTFLSDHSDGRISVHDWFRALMHNLAARHQPYRMGHLRAAFISSAEQAGASAAQAHEFWRAHVDTARALNPEVIFRRAGLHWLDTPQQKPRRLLRLKAAQNPFERLFSPAQPPSHPEPHAP